MPRRHFTMPRRQRAATGNYIYHVLNRAVGRQKIFDSENDYQAFLRILGQVRDKVSCRILAYCIMPNHWHLVLWAQRR